MNRRRRGPLGSILDTLDYLWRGALTLLLWPVYAALDLFYSLFGGRRGMGRSWRDVLLDVVLFIPRWTVVGALFLYQMMLVWPRIIRLRDLAAGLPALLATLIAVLVLFFFEKDETKLIESYQIGSNNSYDKARQESDETVRDENLKLAQFYSRALVKLKPEDPAYRFNVGYLYQEMGDHARAQALMDGLAPRYENGYAKAHLWQADQLMSPDRPLTPDGLDAAESHLERALATYENREEIHRRLGELYYFRYVRYNPNARDPRTPSRDIYLKKAEDHLSKVAVVDPKLALTLAEIRALLGRSHEASNNVEGVIAQLNAKLDGIPDDLETRLQLAHAYRMIRRFADAANVIRVGQNLRPDKRYDLELSSIYYFQSLDYRQRSENSYSDQFAALQYAYVAYPANNYVAHRFVQALSSSKPGESEAARSALQSLVDNKAPGLLAGFLLGFDCQRRNLPSKAEDYYRVLRVQPVDATPAIIAGLSIAVLSQQVRTVNPVVVGQLFEAGLRVWPNDPDMLIARAQQDLMLKDYAKALADLQKALERRPKDAKLHELMAITFQQLGQVEQANKHRKLAETCRANVSPADL